MHTMPATLRLHVLQVLAWSAAHFVVAMIIAVIAFGPDMDQLRSRSTISRAAAAVHDVLWFPHDSALRQIPNAWLIRNRYVIPLAIVINSLAWGVVLYAMSRFFLRLRSRRGSSFD
jgi:hypothetical protein